MTRLVFVSAAFAAGLMVFAAHADERAEAGMTPESSAKAARIVESGKPETKKAEVKKAETKKAQGKLEAEIDPIKTTGVPARTSPKVIFKARKEVKGLVRDDVAAVARAAKATASAGSYSSIVARYAAEYGVPANLAHAVIRVESNYRPNAKGSAGEIGLMQIKPATARGMGYRGNADGLFDPDTNIKYGMLYLAKAHDLAGGNTCGTILRYNAGHAARRMNPVSAAYCTKVKRHLGS